jgi:hypothetical protein
VLASPWITRKFALWGGSVEWLLLVLIWLTDTSALTKSLWKSEFVMHLAVRDLFHPFQGALSTILAVAVLADIPAYTIRTFVKTVFLSISIGLLHGLIFLPVALSLFVRGASGAKVEKKGPAADFFH